MKRIIPLIVIAILGLCDLAFANIRAPYTKEYYGSEELRTSLPGLSVMREDLVFQCDLPYRGSLDEVMGQTRDVMTSATYFVKAEQRTDANFDFILTVNQPVKVSINGSAVIAGAPKLIHKHKESVGFGDTDNSRFKVSFSGRLKQGVNTINVRYSQPMGVQEHRGGIYPIVVSSTFASTFSYDLSPLREWTIDEAFTMNIRITFKDDSGWLKHLFGSDYRIRLYSVSFMEDKSTVVHGETRKRSSRNRTEILGRLNKKAPNDSIDTNIRFYKDFPDMLQVECDY